MSVLRLHKCEVMPEDCAVRYESSMVRNPDESDTAHRYIGYRSWVVDIPVGDNFYGSDHVDIFYCPWCGEKLS
jgi:hypothetical protein